MKKNLLIITENKPGTANQCLGVAQALGNQDPQVIYVDLKTPWRWIYPPLLSIPDYAIKGFNPNTYEQQPDIIIAAGRKAVPVALKFKNSFKVFLQNPRAGLDQFDLIAAPQHDTIKGENIIHTLGAPNRITPNSLKQAQMDLAPILPRLPIQKIAILIGGNSKTHTMDFDFAEKLINDLQPFITSNEYGIMLSLSRRTPENIATFLKQSFEGNANVIIYPNDYFEHNPYQGFLAHANHILVTEDSVSMLCDAATTGKPVYSLHMKGHSKKFDRFYTAMQERIGLREFKGTLENWVYPPLNDAQMVADEIKTRYLEWHKEHKT